VHGASEDLSIQSAPFERCVHVSATPLYGVEDSADVADGYFVPFELDIFHAAGRHLVSF
jgi:hypothetical protein